MSTAPRTTSVSEVKLAGSESKDKMYEPKHKKKLVRVLTVVAYVFSVSLAAITLSLFYIFIYNPERHDNSMGIRHRTHNYSSPVGYDGGPNRTAFIPEEPLAMPVQLADPPQIMDDISQIASESEDRKFDRRDTLTAFRKKRSPKSLLKLLKPV